MQNTFNIKPDFKLNKAEFDALAEMFLNRVSYAETIKTKSEISYKRTPGVKPNLNYASHQNAQDVNNHSTYDCFNFVVDKYINGYYVKTFWVSLGVSNFKYSLLGTSYLQQDPYVLDNFHMDIDFYNFMFYIFGENYKLALKEHLNETMLQKLKIENTAYLNKLKNASKDSERGRVRKFNITKTHIFKRQSITNYYKTRINYANELNEQNFNI